MIKSVNMQEIVEGRLMPKANNIVKKLQRGETKKNTAIRLTDTEKKRAYQYCDANNIGFSGLVRELLTQFLDSEGWKP